MQTGALIAAAGKYDAMEEFRPMMRLGGTSLIQKEIDTLRRADISPIVVVTGHEAEKLERHLAHRGVVCLRNEAYAQGEMLDSVKIGLKWLAARCDSVLFLPADAPLFTEKTIESIRKSKADIVIPSFDGRSGHPILIRERVMPQILTYTGDFGLRGALAVSGAETEVVPVDDPGVLMELRDEDSYRALLDFEKRSLDDHALTFSLKLALGKQEEEMFFGPGLAEFLTRIDSTGSMLAACKEMGMSYSKGWKRVKAAEDGLGFPFLERRAGGADGGNSRLTEKGRAFLNAYLQMEAEVKEAAGEAFGKYFA